MTTSTELTGVIDGIPDADYHALPGLSSTGMKWILRSPAYYAENIKHRVERTAFDVGHAAHAKILGVGMDITVYPDEHLTPSGNVSTKAATVAWVAQQRAKGLAPVTPDQMADVEAMAEAVLRNPKARALLELPGRNEVSLFGIDPDTGVHLRGRIDRLADLPDGRVVNIDVKTTTDVRRHKIRRSIEDFGYDVQSETYRHLLRLNGLDPAPTHLIFVESKRPHEVRVVQLAHPDWIDGGARKMRDAIDLYAQCVNTGQWPGDDDDLGDPEAIEPRPFYLADVFGDDDDVELTL
jgi:PDDEXK-like domain of unknown function (DUF3799)